MKIRFAFLISHFAFCILHLQSTVEIMTFVNLSLLAGTALVALPIILHLIMRRRPTLLEFPALRFLQKRHDVNQRRLQLRHLLLLLLRAGAIARLAFALARPSVKLAGAVGSQEAPVAAALVFDAAPRMEYRHQNQTRLEAGRELGRWLLKQLPEQSEVAVVDTRLGATAAFQADRGAAQERIARLETVANSQPLPVVLDGAAKLLRQSHLDRKELYIFTDLSRGAWPEQQSARLQQQLAELGDLGVYVIDIGITNPTDYGLSDVRLSDEVLSSRSTLGVETSLSSIGAAGQRIVELHMLDADRKPQRRDQQTCDATPSELRPVEFHLGGLTPGTHQGFVRIDGQDGLAADDTRYFTIVVKPAWRVLMAAPKPAQSYALFLTEALAPDLFRKRGQARFDCDICDLGELANRPLTDYAAVCLLDPTPLEPATWKQLADYAAEGRAWRSSSAATRCRSNRSTVRRRKSCCRASSCVRPAAPTATCIWPRAIISTRSCRLSAARPARSPGMPFPCFAIGNSEAKGTARFPKKRACPPFRGERRPALQRRKAGHLGACDRPGARADDDYACL